MKRHFQKAIVLLVLMTAVCLLGGCQFVASVEELMTLPQMPLEYEGLSQQIESLIAEGYEYASPTSGKNIQSVQMVDLNGDGAEEAVAFFRKQSDEKPLKIAVFHPEQGAYSLMCTIESSGTAVESVSYQDLTGDGSKEMIVGWKISTDVQNVAVYKIAAAPVTLLRSGYTKFTIQMMDPDTTNGCANLIVVRSDAEGESIAELYGWENDTMAVVSSCVLSSTMAELNHGSIASGMLDDKTVALYVTGVNDQNMAVTDILACKKGVLANMVENRKTGRSDVVYPYCQLEPQDIDDDGMMEIPVPEQEASDKQIDGIISWYRYDEDGQASWAMDTYHCLSAGWYITLPADWHSRTTAALKDNSTSEAQVTLCVDDESVATVYTISGENRENRAVRGNRFVLKRQTTVIYAGELTPDSGTWDLDEAFLRENFNLILGSWTSADN